jgi:predicted Zn-dependent protease
MTCVQTFNRTLLARLAAAVLVLLCLGSCATNPVTGETNFVLMSEAQEVSLGARADQDIKKQYSLYDLKGLQAYVESVGQKLAQVSHRTGLSYRFTVLDSPEVNAFALPGGYIYITRGLIAYLNSEAELAAVLGHELGHVTARHGVRQASAAQGTDLLLNILGAVSPAMRSSGLQNVSGLLVGALLSGYGREHELEADRIGAEYLARAGYDPQAMIRVIGVLKNHELFDAEVAKQEGRQPRAYHGLFASHPDNDTRLKEVVAAADKFRTSSSTQNRESFIDHSNGMIFGDSPREGIRRGGTFFHPDLGFALEIPAGWRLSNLPDRLVFTAPSGDARMELRSDNRPKDSPADMLRRLTRGTANDIDVSPVNSLPAARADVRGRPAAIIYLGDRAYVFAGAAQSDEAARRAVAALRDSLRSFRAISAEERKRARPLVLTLLRADAATRMAQLAKASPLGSHAEGYLRLINGLYPSGEPAPGQTIKIVD